MSDWKSDLEGLFRQEEGSPQKKAEIQTHAQIMANKFRFEVVPAAVDQIRAELSKYDRTVHWLWDDMLIVVLKGKSEEYRYPIALQIGRDGYARIEGSGVEVDKVTAEELARMFVSDYIEYMRKH